MPVRILIRGRISVFGLMYMRTLSKTFSKKAIVKTIIIPYCYIYEIKSHDLINRGRNRRAGYNRSEGGITV